MCLSAAVSLLIIGSNIQMLKEYKVNFLNKVQVETFLEIERIKKVVDFSCFYLLQLVGR